jgi:hypothetical protein
VASGLVINASNYGSDYGYGGDRATTPIQGIDYGIARIIRDEGVYNLLTSQAALDLSEVQRREILNWRLWTETYFELRKLNHEARAAERGRHPTEADFIRYAQMGKPRRLTPSELDAVTGQLTWPVLLQTPEFAPFRGEVQRAFAQRAATGVMSGEESFRVRQVGEMMLGLLRQQIQDVPAVDFIAARRFVESLMFEARLAGA